MIKNLYTCIGKGFDPYENLALEEVLLRNVPKDSCILYLWQNQKTVVIGKNQNAWTECKIKELEKDGGHLARRLSGGGAVFHDLGNLNFTFLMNTSDYDLDKQLNVIMTAVNSFGIKTEKSGRNDIITEDGRKFSGNAFYHNNDKSYHHGTIMINVDKEKVAEYLNVSTAKLASKGVKSVKSRVANLTELNPNITVENMTKALFKAFEEVYGGKAETFVLDENAESVITSLKERNESFEWKLGKKMQFDLKLENRFNWGGIEIELKIDEGLVQEALVYSDAMDVEFITKFAPLMTGEKFSSENLANSLKKLSNGTLSPLQKEMAQDIIEYIGNQEF